MRMTVGPLPATVYWRRRVIVLGVLLVAVLLLWASCSSGSSGGPGKKTAATARSASSNAPAAPATTAAAGGTYQVPSTDVPVTPTGAAATTPPAGTAPAGTVPACADADLQLAATPDQPVQFRGAYLKFTLKIKDITTHDCVRDVGADFQEMYLQVGAIKMWSSDACDAPHGSQMTTLKPNIEVSFTNNWNGKESSNGCANREAPPAGKYQLVGRLGTKLSEPVTVQLT